MAEYYIAPKSSFDATADAIREKTGSQATIEWTEDGFADAIEDIPTGGGGGWQRPSDWPDYSKVALSGTELYLTVDTNVPFPFLAFKVVGTGAITLERGELSGGVFTPTSSQTVTSNTEPVIELESEPGYAVFRLTTTGTITQFTIEDNSITVGTRTMHRDAASIIEAYGRLPDATRVRFRGLYILESVMLFDMTALNNLHRSFNECRSLINVKITGITNLTEFYFAFNTTAVLKVIDLDGYNLKTVTSAGSCFNNCGATSINAVLDFSGFTGGFGAAQFQGYKGPHVPSNVYFSGTGANNFFREVVVKKVINPSWNTGSITNFSYMLYNNPTLIEVDLSTLDFTSATNTGNMMQNCIGLQKATLPASLSRVDASFLAGCGSLNEVHFKSTTPPAMANTNAFSGVPSTCKIYVPYSADHSILEAYQTATNWSTYASQMHEEAAP